jgi:hypothetical protein
VDFVRETKGYNTTILKTMQLSATFIVPEEQILNPQCYMVGVPAMMARFQLQGRGITVLKVKNCNARIAG